jgi:lipoprotein Spr
MRLGPRYVLVLVALVSILGCAGKKATNNGYNRKQMSLNSLSESQIRKSLLEEYRSWKGTPHRMGGNTKKGVDCSGFVHQVYKRALKMEVPRSTKLLMRAGVRINKKELKPGDMVTFRPPTFPRHVGIYVGGNKFIHASKSQGVTMTDLNNAYWKKCYYSSRRLFVR